MSIYGKEVYEFINSYGDEVIQTAQIAEVDPAFVASVISEEFDDSVRDGPGVRFGIAAYEVVSRLTSSWQLNRNFEHIAEVGDRPWEDSVFFDLNGRVTQRAYMAINPVLRDMGPANIKIFTAMEIVNEQTSDPNAPFHDALLGYVDDPRALVQDLADPSNQLSANIAAVIVGRAITWFEQQMPPGAWEQLPRDLQAGLISTYYNLGSRTILERYNEHTRYGEVGYYPRGR